MIGNRLERWTVFHVKNGIYHLGILGVILNAMVNEHHEPVFLPGLF